MPVSRPVHYNKYGVLRTYNLESGFAFCVENDSTREDLHLTLGENPSVRTTVEGATGELLSGFFDLLDMQAVKTLIMDVRTEIILWLSACCSYETIENRSHSGERSRLS